jgi:hypothetical protein
MPNGATSLGQRLHPALDAELRRGVSRRERLPRNAGGRGDRHDKAAAPGPHEGKHGSGDVHRAEQVGLDLCSEVFGGKFLEKPGVEVARVIDEDVDAAEPRDGGGHGRLGVCGAGNVELDDEQVGGVTECPGNSVGVAAGRDDGVPRNERRLHDVNAHPTAGTGHEPDGLVSHGKSSCSRTAE